jgi:serine/threonine-protein kinase PpkA
MEIPGYKIDRRIGQGGMASAYLAIQDSLGRQVVLKVLDTTKVDSPESVERFLNEGRMVAALNHPYIVTIYDIGITEDAIYISMEYVEGGDLKQRLKRYSSVENALELLAKIGSALEAAHRKGIIHRDVKPANILFRKNGTPLLTDFGIAKQLVTDHEITSTGIFLGSPNYMAPEQAEGGGIDGRADIYSLGIIFYELVTGKKPYQSSSVIDVIMQHKQAPIPKLPDGLEPYQELLELMMAKQRSDRFKDASSMLYYLEKLRSTTVAQASTANVTPASEFVDSTGQHFKIADITAEMQRLKELSTGTAISLKKSRRNLLILIGLVVIGVLGFGGMMFVESTISGGSGFNAKPPSNAALQTIAPVDPIVSPADQAGVPPAGANSNGGIPTPQVTAPVADSSAPVATSAIPAVSSSAEVITALRWLAKNSLEEYKLTYPPKDNAYYYYSRLLQIDPDSPVAKKGMLDVAERFAFLAEKELANNEKEKALQYITVGLQIDPTNRALLTLSSLSQSGEKGFFNRILGLFH